MSVLIKGMEMPTRCWDCLLNTYGYCMASEHSDIIPSDAPIPSWCPLVPVPPHGKLIEKNAVFELIRSFLNVDRQLPVEFMKALYELPTIIEAEEGE